MIPSVYPVVGLLLCVVALAAIALSPALKQFRACWWVVAVILATLYAGTKPKVEFPRGITDDGSLFDTNSWSYVELRWKLVQGFPVESPIQIEAALGGGSVTNFAKIADDVAGSLTNRIMASTFVTSGHLTNYVFRMKSDYVPGTVEINDMTAYAMKSVRAVVCSWSCPTNIVGMAGIVQAQRNIVGAPWMDKQTVILGRTNTVTIAGNFVSRGIGWNFRVLVPGYSPITLTNLTQMQIQGNGGER